MQLHTHHALSKTKGFICLFFLLAFFAIASLVLGFVLTSDGSLAFDDSMRFSNSLWLTQQLGIKTVNQHVDYFQNNTGHYVIEILFGIATEVVFAFLKDPLWVRHAVNFAMYPMMLVLSFLLLQAVGVRRSTAMLTVAMMFGIIRFGGHAVINVKDAYYAIWHILGILALWALFLRVHNRALQNRLAFGSLAAVGGITALLFSAKPPDFSHVLFAGIFCVLYAMFGCNLSVPKRVGLVCIPVIAFFFSLSFVYPPFHFFDFYNLKKQFADSFADHMNHGAIGDARIFGKTYGRNELPWWYSVGWIPIMSHPLTLVAAVFGVVGFFISGTKNSKFISLRVCRWRASLHFGMWLWLFVWILWAGILILHPKNYDEERHILFIYPSLFVLGALGLDWLRSNAKYALSAAIFFTSLFTYVQWGTLSYVYASPLIMAGNDSNFLSGDYWGVCVSEGIGALDEFVPPGMYVQTHVKHIAQLEQNRRRTGLLTGNPVIGLYQLVDSIPQNTTTYVRLVNNRFGSYRRDLQRVEKDINDGKASLLWEKEMPSDGAACILALYE